MTKQIYGIVGHPVKHSLSPAMQNAAFNHLEISAEYRLFEVSDADFDKFLDKIREERDVAGLNITIPHKIRAKEYLERVGSLDENAAKLGAVNTIKIAVDGQMKGFNTDGPGFYRSLVQDLKFEPEGKNIFVLGSGGAAKAVAMFLGSKAGTIFVFDTDRDKMSALRNHYAKYFDVMKLNLVSGAGRIKESLDNCDLLINATPVGMKDSDVSPIAKKFLRPDLCVYDLVYNRPSTQLIRDAREAGACALTGVGMLLYQGALAFEIWTGKSAPIDIMRRALEGSIKDNYGL